MQNGDAVTNVSIATSENWKDKSGEKQEKTEWHNLVFYRRLAEVVGEHLKKGSMIYVEGKLQTRKWDKEGVTHFSTEVIVNEMTMLGSRADRAENTGHSESSPAAPATKKPARFDDPDQDIPF